MPVRAIRFLGPLDEAVSDAVATMVLAELHKVVDTGKQLQNVSARLH